MLSEFINFIVDTVGSFGYTGIIIMMALESSFVPFPSEVVMVPAGYLASKGEMSLAIVIFSGIFGSIIGALVNYFIAIKLGRKLLKKYGKYFLMNDERMEKIESFFTKHGSISTFTGRLIPVIRQYISFPAGLAKMNLLKFTIYTGSGAGIWVTVLALIGYVIGENEQLVKDYTHNALLVTLVLVMVLIFAYIKYHKRKEA
jgi:membrane protein DedA with SNARE-associated domain